MDNSNSPAKPDRPLSLATTMLIGAGVGLTIISFFVFGADNPDPEWGDFWRIRPLIVTPFAGAMGAAFYYFMDHLSSKGLNPKIAAVLSLVVFIIALWLGTVLGLAGTMWD